MRIAFVFPSYARTPVGGFKVVYEYASRLSARGHKVTMVHPRIAAASSSPRQRVKAQLWPYKVRLVDRGIERWLRLDRSVRRTFVPDLRSKFIPDGDFVFATSWQTAEQVATYPDRKGIKMYFVQDYELWMTEGAQTRRKMAATYRAELNMVATSSAVEEVLIDNSTPPIAKIFHGLDFSEFALRVPIPDRRWGAIGFPLRRSPVKGSIDAIDAIKLLREAYGASLDVKAFGAEPWPNLPDWINYVQYPSNLELAEFYNSLAVFVLPSHYEAWGLPGVEALACGASLVISDNVGGRDFAQNDETALVVPRRRPDLLAGSIRKLLEDDSLRQRLATRGHEYVQQYTWSRAVETLERLLLDLFRSHGLTEKAAVAVASD